MILMTHSRRRHFPNVVIVLQILAICPVTTAQIERANSMLKLVKTARRSISGQDDNLNAFFCLILSYKLVHDDEVDLDAVIRAWSQRKKRRIAFAFPFQMIKTTT